MRGIPFPNADGGVRGCDDGHDEVGDDGTRSKYDGENTAEKPAAATALRGWSAVGLSYSSKRSEG